MIVCKLNCHKLLNNSLFLETPLNQLSSANPVDLSFNSSNEYLNITCSSPLALPLSDVNPGMYKLIVKNNKLV